MRKFFSPLILICLSVLAVPAKAQDLVSQNVSLHPIRQWYKDMLGSNSRIFTGSEYAIKYVRNVDHQFLLQDWEKGAIVYQDRFYTDQDLKFDIVNDQIIFKFFNPDDGRMMSLRPAQEKVSGFTLNSRQFVKLASDTSNQISGGFYELIFDKEYKLFLKHTKEEFVDKSRGAPVVGFLYKAKIYLLKNGSFYFVRNRGSLLKLLEDEKKALKAFARRENLYWKENPRRNAALLVNHYLQLKAGDTSE